MLHLCIRAVERIYVSQTYTFYAIGITADLAADGHRKQFALR